MNRLFKFQLFLLLVLSVFIDGCKHEMMEPDLKTEHDCKLISKIELWPQGFTDTTYYFYNDLGLESERRRYAHGTSTIYIDKRAYDDDERVIRVEYFYNDELQSRISYEYDRKSNVIHQTEVGSNGIVYEEINSEYGPYGITSKNSTYSLVVGVTIYTEFWRYDEAGRIYENEFTSVNNYTDSLNQYNGLGMSLRKNYVFSNSDQILMCDIFSRQSVDGPLSNYDLVGKEYYEYDTQGNLISFKSEDELTKNVNTTTWQFDYKGRETHYEYSNSNSDYHIVHFDYVYDNHDHLREYKYQTHYHGPLVYTFTYSCSQ